MTEKIKNAPLKPQNYGNLEMDDYLLHETRVVRRHFVTNYAFLIIITMVAATSLIISSVTLHKINKGSDLEFQENVEVMIPLFKMVDVKDGFSYGWEGIHQDPSVLNDCKLSMVGDSGVSHTGYWPSEIKQAYRMQNNNSAGSGKTIAIVVAYHAPNTQYQLNQFTAAFDLPDCTTTNGCLEIVKVGTVIVPSDPTWLVEAAMDLQWAHAMSPGSKKILVECNSPSIQNMVNCIQTAANMADYVSMSFGIYEPSSIISSMSSLDYTLRTRSNTGFFAASGDNGASDGAIYPSSNPNVVAVGGTRLAIDLNGNFTETAWSGSGGGCSSLYSSSTQQADFKTELALYSCAESRTIPDLSAFADPDKGAMVYLKIDNYLACGIDIEGWFVMGGTSLSTPVITGFFANLGYSGRPSSVYSLPNTQIRDIKQGSNGYPAISGYDLVTGRGSLLGPI